MEEDSPLAAQARRLSLSGALTRRAIRALGTDVVPGDAEPAALVELARALTRHAGADQRAHRVRLRPDYPGVSAGVERASGAARLVLACSASYERGQPLGVVFTTLIAGRPPFVAVAPPDAPIPPDWRPLP